MEIESHGRWIRVFEHSSHVQQVLKNVQPSEGSADGTSFSVADDDKSVDAAKTGETRSPLAFGGASMAASIAGFGASSVEAAKRAQQRNAPRSGVNAHRSGVSAPRSGVSAPPSDDGSDVRNTRSLHLWAVSLCTDVVQDSGRAWLATGLSLLLDALQIFALVLLGFEASHRGCSAHTDCLTGEYCLAPSVLPGG